LHARATYARRAAGLMAIKATAHYHSTAEIVHKVFPSVIALTIDPDDAVRAQALSLARWLLDRVEKGPAEADTTVAATSAAVNKGAAGSSWAWASSAVTSVFTKVAAPKTPKSDSGDGAAQGPAASKTSAGGRSSTGAAAEEEEVGPHYGSTTPFSPHCHAHNHPIVHARAHTHTRAHMPCSRAPTTFVALTRRTRRTLWTLRVGLHRSKSVLQASDWPFR
jgi:hypothetical protein